MSIHALFFLAEIHASFIRLLTVHVEFFLLSRNVTGVVKNLSLQHARQVVYIGFTLSGAAVGFPFFRLRL